MEGGLSGNVINPYNHSSSDLWIRIYSGQMPPGGNDVSDFDDYSGDAFYLQYITNSADPEIEAMYSNSGSNIKSYWDAAKSFRKV